MNSIAHERITQAIEAIESDIASKRQVLDALKALIGGPYKVPVKGGKRKLTKAGREAIREAVKRRWRKQKAAQKAAK